MYRQRDRSLGDGVYFAASNYVGLGPRIVILIVDTVALGVILSVFTFAWLVLVGTFDGAFQSLAILTMWPYSVPLKRSRFRTLGYRIAGARLVTLSGQRPSLFMMTVRSLLWLITPFNIVLDLIWCGIDEDRQTLRDRYTSMCVVHNDAVPVGTGEIHLTYFTAFGYAYFYPHVVRPKTVEA